MIDPRQAIADEPVLRAVGKLIVPFALLFGLYTQFHGDFGPGGGFQAGVIFAAAFMLYGLIYGPEALRKIAPARVVEVLVAIGPLIYGGVGAYSLFRGRMFLDYSALDPEHPAHGQHLGILLVELGVGITVCAVMLTIYFFFTGRRRES